LTLAQQIVVVVAVALILYNLIVGTVAFLSPLGVACAVVLIGLFYRFRIPPDSGSEDDGYELLERALRLERKGRIEDALKAYEEIAEKYAHHSAGLDAKKSAENLRRQR